MAKLSAEQQHPVEALGWAARDTSGVLSPFKFSRRTTEEKDVTFKVLYCGVCHSDLHTIKNEWGNTNYPSLPGHEIVGVVTEVGSKVQKFKLGDKVGVGCLVGSCHSCDNCANDLENYCPKMLFTYNSIYYDGTPNYGGYSNIMVADEHFVIRIPDSLPLDGCAPLLCAGITTYSPLKHFGLDQPGMHVGVVGLGGLGHAAVKFAKAFGVKVTVISTSSGKKKEAIERLGADSFLDSRDPTQMQLIMGTMDGIIDTVSAPHPLLPLIGLLKSHGKLILVGVPEKPLELPVFPLIMGGENCGGSCIGGIKETQEMIDFAAKHNITADIEVIPMDYVNLAMERLVKADVRYRFVIDIGNTLKMA
ncbi:putative mannitol dehydrogenase [Camellia lanceoleosa]|uniref:Mannitol dehydrogenase n=1 Tax=Camellia lanceoleosa TaxID=1840588 RepID=A0ACC0HZ18_9ERIC|nr:putative mannitol dehydrogenase [Camellia lanceoleosa]